MGVFVRLFVNAITLEGFEMSLTFCGRNMWSVARISLKMAAFGSTAVPGW